MLLLLAAQDAPPKAAWEWTNEERIAARKDPLLRIQRREEAFAAGDMQRYDKSDILVGLRDPELFLPTELMHHLIAAYRREPYAPKGIRARWASATERFGEDFWERLYETGRPYFDAEARHLQLQLQDQDEKDPAERQRLSTEESMVSNSLCPLRVEALRAAREVFGREAFDRFLYEVVAPVARIRGSSSGPDGPFSDLWQEEGCP